MWIDPVSFGRGKTITDVLKAIDRIDDIALDMAIAADTYFSTAAYLR